MNQSSVTAHPDLRKQLGDLELVHASILAYNQRTVRPPVLDSSLDALPAPSPTVPGLRPFLESVVRDKEALAGFLADPHVAELPPLSTNAPYLISVWKEVLAASETGPILAIGKTFYDGKPGRVRQPKDHGTKSVKNVGVKVDVVAEDRRSWIRVNTTKNSRLLAEFREIDSYDTGSESEDEHGRPSLAQREFDNSVLSAGRALLAAARSNMFPTKNGPEVPNVTLRLTRLDPDSSNDKRIARTIELLREMGLTVLLGDRPGELPSRSVAAPSGPAELIPTTRVNLDLSILIAFTSDLTHATLPATEEEAESRFVPSSAYIEWKRSRLRAKKGDDGEDAPVEADDDLIKHSRALVDQQKQEMVRGLLHEVHRRLSMSSKSSDLSDVEFWTTKEARDRCLRIVAKIGGPDERRRVKALFPSSDIPLEQAQQEYWHESRYPVNYVPLLPIRIYPTPSPTDPSQPTSRFAEALEATCRDLLAQGPTDSPKKPPAHVVLNANGNGHHDEEVEKLSTALGDSTIGPESTNNNTSVDDEIGRASVTRANPKLTEHTVQSMLWGAARGSTTLTANRASVKAFLREMRMRGLGTAGIDVVQADGDGIATEDAVIWTVDPRSLAEGMRSDFVAPDS